MTEHDQELDIAQRGRVATLTINRPHQRNALTPALLGQLALTLDTLARDDEVRCVVIRGAGDRAFSSGYDIGAIRTPAAGEKAGAGQGQERADNPMQWALRSLWAYPYPVIALIHGFCMGGGLELAVTCDLRLAAETGRFCMPPARLGVVYSPIGLRRFIDQVGVGQTNYLFFSGRTIDAAEALRLGLVEQVHPADQLEAAVYGLAEEIAGNAPLSLKGTKHIIHKLLGASPLSPDDRHQIDALIAQSFASEDLQEGRRAFAEKRRPVFQGR